MAIADIPEIKMDNEIEIDKNKKCYTHLDLYAYICGIQTPTEWPSYMKDALIHLTMHGVIHPDNPITDKEFETVVEYRKKMIKNG